MNTDQRLNEIRARLAQLDTNNRDHLGEISNLKTQEAELMQEQAKQERITTAISETAEVVDNLEIAPGMNLRDMCIDEQSYQFVKISFQTLLNQKDAKYIDEIAAAAERESNLSFQIKHRDLTIDNLEAQIEQLQEQIKVIPVLTFERDEALKVRDNAAAEVDGLKLVIDEKQKQIDTLRNEIAVGAKGAVQIDQTEQMRLAQEAWKASRIKVTNIRWEDELKKTHYLAEDMQGDTIRFGRLEKGKYMEVSEEEVQRFRAEAAAAIQESTHEPVALVETPEIVTVQQFRPDEGPVRHDEGMDTSAVGEVAPEEHVTRGEFEARMQNVEKGMEQLMRQVFGEVTGDVA